MGAAFNLVPGVFGLVTLPPLTLTYGQGYTRKRFEDRREGGILAADPVVIRKARRVSERS